MICMTVAWSMICMICCVVEHEEGAAVKGGSAPGTPRPPSTPVTPTPTAAAVRARPGSATLPPQSSISPLASSEYTPLRQGWFTVIFIWFKVFFLVNFFSNVIILFFHLQ